MKTKAQVTQPYNREQLNNIAIAYVKVLIKEGGDQSLEFFLGICEANLPEYKATPVQRMELVDLTKKMVYAFGEDKHIAIFKAVNL